MNLLKKKKIEEQIMMDEDLLIVKSRNSNELKLRDRRERMLISEDTTDTTPELGSGSPEVSTSYSSAYFNSTITSIGTRLGLKSFILLFNLIRIIF